MINPLDYVDEEFQETYRWIGVDVPGGGDDEEDRSSSNSRGKHKAVEDAVVRFGVFLLFSKF